MLVPTLLLLTAPSASAETCHYEVQTITVNGNEEVHAVKVCTPSETPIPVGTNGPPLTTSGLDPRCVTVAMENGVDPLEYCDAPPEAGPTLLTPGLVATALRHVPLPASQIEVEPPNGRTLVNFDTNFFTTTGEFDRTVRLLGQHVDLHIVPSTFTWQFGDGHTLTTEDPGAPYPDLDVTHAYLKKGGVAPRVDTTYTAQFRVNGGPWQDVPGSVTIEGTPVQLEVLTATPVLVGYN